MAVASATTCWTAQSRGLRMTDSTINARLAYLRQWTLFEIVFLFVGQETMRRRRRIMIIFFFFYYSPCGVEKKKGRLDRWRTCGRGGTRVVH